MDDKRICDYFVVAGLPNAANRKKQKDLENQNQQNNQNPLQSLNRQKNQPPITDITVIIPVKGEEVPDDYECIEFTPNNHSADLNHGSIKSPSIYLCFRRGIDKPPLTDIGVYYESQDDLLPDSCKVEKTFYGNDGNVNNGNSNIYLTYRRAKPDAPCNQLVVTDICVILPDKNETPPHAFNLINKNLNKGLIGSNVFICYKKSMYSPPLLRFIPSISDRYPKEDLDSFKFPEEVAMFCLPLGSTIECWPKESTRVLPLLSNFVLTSEDGTKIYGVALTFYENFQLDELDTLTNADLKKLGYFSGFEQINKKLVVNKSICILSRLPFLDVFEGFLNFLYKSVFRSFKNPLNIPIEVYISHFMINIPFPSIHRPKICIQLSQLEEDQLTLSNPFEDTPLPLNGASYVNFLQTLGPDNAMDVFLYVLLEQKILLHSLKLDVLTSVAEALTSLIFPFHWQCPYIPVCPLPLNDVLNAPLPFICGVDSRYFETQLPPSDLICIDLDTRSIYMCETKRCLMMSKLVPKKAYKNLKKALELIAFKLHTAMHEMRKERPTINFSQLTKKLEKKFGIEIQEAFLQFMTFILKDFRNYLIPIQQPSIGSTDLTSLFNFKEFISSREKNYHKFYTLLMKDTQMFCRFIEERTFHSDKYTSLAFFDECLNRIESTENIDFSTFQLIELDDHDRNDHTVFISDPESLVNLSNYTPPYKYNKFGPLNYDLFLKEPILGHFENNRRISVESKSIESIDNQLNRNNSSNLNLFQQEIISNSSPMMMKRTKHEIRAQQRVAKRLAETPLTWSKCLISYCYSLWFLHLHSYIKANQQISLKAKLKIAFNILLRMQSLDLHPLDEVCYRILMLLSGVYSQPILAVKILHEMKKNNVTPNAITYITYSKAVLESDWKPDLTDENVFWKKLRYLINTVAKFKESGKQFSERRKLNEKNNSLEALDNKNDSNSTLSTLDKHDSLFSRQFSKTSSFREKKLNKNRTLFNEEVSQKSSIVKGINLLSQNDLINYSTEAGLLINDKKLQLKNERNQLERRRHKSEEQADQEKFNLNKLKEELMNASTSVSKTVLLKRDMPRSQSLSVYKRQNVNHSNSNNLSNKTILEDENHSRKSSVSLLNDKENLTNNLINSNNSSTIDFGDNIKRRSSEIPKGSDTSSFYEKSESTNCSNENMNNNNLQSTESLDSENSTFSPLKDAIKNINPFSFSENKVASTLRSSFRLTKSFAKSQFANSSLFRTSLNKQKSNPIVEGQTSLDNNKSHLPENGLSTESLNDNNSEIKCNMMTRSSTLPLSISSNASNDNETENSLKNSSVNDNESSSNEMIKSHSSTDFNSIWSTKFNKNNQYLNSTFKFATNTMNRISEIKSQLSEFSNTGSPINNKPSTTNGAQQTITSNQNNAFIQNTSALFTNIASMVAEKLPANVSQFNELYDYYMFNSDWPDSSETASNKNETSDKFFDTLNQQYKFNSNKELDQIEKNLLKIEMTSCTKCYNCLAILYDEELMSGWTSDDSNLNTTCRYCEKLIVPKLTIKIKFNEKLLNSKIAEGELINGINMKSSSSESSTDNELFKDFKKLSFAYLSPIVLRKELENIVENEGDFCLTNPQFTLEHDISYWNLLWYFQRTNLPTHLSSLYLNQFLKEKNLDHLNGVFDSRNVNVICLWDNENLYEDIPKPIYYFYKKSYSKEEETSSLISALVTEKKTNDNKIIFNLLLDYIYKDDLVNAIRVFIHKRRATPNPQNVKYFYSIYRDLLYLLFAAVDDLSSIDNIAFDRIYRHAYDLLTDEEIKLMRPTDKPPSLKATFCRRSFKQLILKVNP